MSTGLDFEGPVEVVAHRGYSAHAPENTLAAMELAIDVGADALEFDIHTARDGTPFLFHDATLVAVSATSTSATFAACARKVANTPGASTE